MAKAPPPAPVPTPPADAPSAGDVWAFRLFVLLFGLTLVIGLGNYLLSYIKYHT